MVSLYFLVLWCSCYCSLRHPKNLDIPPELQALLFKTSLLVLLVVVIWMVDVFWLQVDHHDPENSSLLRFNALWEAHYRQDSLLVFSTGRSPTLYKQLRKEKPMITPDIAIMSVGTEITYGRSMMPDDGWVQFLNQKWDKNIVIEETSKFPELKPQVSFIGGDGDGMICF